jgi:hypothetical protein
MRRRKRQIPKTKIEKDVNRQRVEIRVAELTRLRTLGMSPFPFTSRQMYEMVLGEKLVGALKLVPQEMLNCGEYFRFKVWQPERATHANIQILMTEKVPLISGGEFMDAPHLSEEELRKVVDWVWLRRTVGTEEAKVDAAIKVLLNTANTYGQIKGFWPTFGIFLPRDIRDEFDAKRASRPTDEMVHAWSAATTLSPKDVDRILSEALMFDGMTFDDQVTLFGS